jgi:hypothetical protein
MEIAEPAKNKRMGTLYENIFICEALKRNLQPHVPVGDYLPHDLIVYTPSGICVRVQIKGTSCRHPHRSSSRYKIQSMEGSKKLKLQTTSADILAAYVAPWDYWYLIPVSSLASPSVWMYPGKEKGRGQYEKYRNGWEVFSDEEYHVP